MTNQNEGWDTIEVPSKDEDNKIEFEVESEEEKPIEAVEEQPKEEVVEAAPRTSLGMMTTASALGRPSTW